MSAWAHRVSSLVFVLLIPLAVAGCYAEPVVLTTYPPTEEPGLIDQPTDQPAPTDETGAPATPTLVPTGVAADCVNGWADAPDDNAQFGTAMYLVERQMEVAGPWTVDEVRYFTGPDVSWAESPAPVVERWYVKAALTDTPDFRGRWLIEKRSDFDFGVVAVAPYSTAGYQSPDWTGFVGDGSPTTYLGLPGQWTGTPYDFVSGAGFSGEPGLPDEVIGCMSGT
jgi:hypothetical protein